MFAIVEAIESKTSATKTTIEIARYLTHRDADKAITELYVSGRYDSYVERMMDAPVWIEHVSDIFDGQPEIGTFRTARDGRSFVQVSRVCVWGRRGESEASLRARKSMQIENA